MKSFNKSDTGISGKLKGLVTNSLKKIDRFGHPISLTYESEPAFKSAFGGTMTLFSLLARLIYLGFMIQTVIARS